MSFPEGPTDAVEQSTYDDDPVDPAPTDGPRDGLAGAIRDHVEHWAGRYVEMRVEARTGRRD
ncbi:hypothetical protein ACFQGE_00500 [Halomicroarcula sp. GCM10025817]|uniref:hypothetical protein n=1 Tax=Haloarcula TaxID=2237 RepID=UPI0023E77B25|nr:hypothetical protein [Halomicroarcula sp. SYNS111]